MSNYNHRKVYTSRSWGRRKENVVPADPQNVCSTISDEEALKIHGLCFENNGYSSDSGKSDFDEEYYMNKPRPLYINRRKIVTIKRLNTKNQHPQVKEGYVQNAEIKKDISNPAVSGKSDSSFFSHKTSFGKHRNSDHHQFKNLETVNPYIRPNFNKFVKYENSFQSLEDITCQSSITNQLPPKRPSKNVQDVQTSSNIEDNSLIHTNLSKTYQPKFLNKTGFHSVDIDALANYRNGRDVETPNISEIFTGNRKETIIVNNLNIHNIPAISGITRNISNLTSAHESKRSILEPNYNQFLILNFSDLPNVIQTKQTKVPDSSLRRNPKNSLPACNLASSQNIRASSNSNFNLSTHQDLLVREPSGTTQERRISENTLENAGRNETYPTSRQKSRQSTIPSYNKPLPNPPNVITKVPKSSSRINSKNSVLSRDVSSTFPSQSTQPSSDRNLNLLAHRDLLVREQRIAVEESISEETELSNKTNESNFCGICLSFIFCRKC